MIGKLLDIFRVFYNFVEVGKNKQTPAMRLGLAKGNRTKSEIDSDNDEVIDYVDYYTYELLAWHMLLWFETTARSDFYLGLHISADIN